MWKRESLSVSELVRRSWAPEISMLAYDEQVITPLCMDEGELWLMSLPLAQGIRIVRRIERLTDALLELDDALDALVDAVDSSVVFEGDAKLVTRRMHAGRGVVRRIR